MKFLTIGSGYKKTSKKSGMQYISLTVLKEKLDLVDSADYKKFCLFVNQWKHGHDDRPDYTLCVPMKEEPTPPTQPEVTQNGLGQPLPWEADKCESLGHSKDSCVYPK